MLKQLLYPPRWKKGIVIKKKELFDNVTVQSKWWCCGSTYPNVIHNKNKLSHIAIWELLFPNVMLNESLYIMFWAVTIASIDSINCYA